MINDRRPRTAYTLHFSWSLLVLQRFLSLLKEIIKNNRILLSFTGSIIFIYLASPTYRSILIGIPLILFGEIFRTWASGFIKKDKEIAQEGPYALTRNPLYLGNFFIGLGFTIMANNLLILFLFLASFSLIYIVTIKNEEKRLSDKFGDIYLAYKNRVPVFFPMLSLRAPEGCEGSACTERSEEISFLVRLLRRSAPRNDNLRDFDWHLVKKHREYRTWLGIAGCLLVFVLKVL